MTGIQVSTLSPAAKNELALLVAKRKVLVFRSQDFRDLGMENAVDFCNYFGRPVVHPQRSYIFGFPEFHIAHSSNSDIEADDTTHQGTTSIAWCNDSPRLVQPPGMVFLYMLECPDVGGDTIFCNMAEAYKKFSPAFQETLHGVEAEHMVDGVRTGVHPLIRMNPVTGEMVLFVRPACESNLGLHLVHELH